jgi:curved DNA-binding protein CbpA
MRQAVVRVAKVSPPNLDFHECALFVMIDYFALLDQPRQPWLDPESLKAKFLALSADLHPDRIHQASPADQQAANQRYAELNTAYHCLREPKDRLRHLLELETGAKPKEVERISLEALELFAQVNRVVCDADTFLVEKEKAKSPMLKAQLFARSLDRVEELKALHRKLEAGREGLVAELKSINAAWESAARIGMAGRVGVGALSFDRLEQIYRDLGFLGRWSAQIYERLVRFTI